MSFPAQITDESERALRQLDAIEKHGKHVAGAVEGLADTFPFVSLPARRKVMIQTLFDTLKAYVERTA